MDRDLSLAVRFCGQNNWSDISQHWQWVELLGRRKRQACFGPSYGMPNRMDNVGSYLWGIRRPGIYSDFEFDENGERKKKMYILLNQRPPCGNDNGNDQRTKMICLGSQTRTMKDKQQWWLWPAVATTVTTKICLRTRIWTMIINLGH